MLSREPSVVKRPSISSITLEVLPVRSRMKNSSVLNCASALGRQNPLECEQIVTRQVHRIGVQRRPAYSVSPGSSCTRRACRLRRGSSCDRSGRCQRRAWCRKSPSPGRSEPRSPNRGCGRSSRSRARPRTGIGCTETPRPSSRRRAGSSWLLCPAPPGLQARRAARPKQQGGRRTGGAAIAA